MVAEQNEPQYAFLLRMAYTYKTPKFPKASCILSIHNPEQTKSSPNTTLLQIQPHQLLPPATKYLQTQTQTPPTHHIIMSSKASYEVKEKPSASSSNASTTTTTNTSSSKKPKRFRPGIVVIKQFDEDDNIYLNPIRPRHGSEKDHVTSPEDEREREERKKARETILRARAKAKKTYEVKQNLIKKK